MKKLDYWNSINFFRALPKKSQIKNPQYKNPHSPKIPKLQKSPLYNKFPWYKNPQNKNPHYKTNSHGTKIPKTKIPNIQQILMVQKYRTI